ncbi:cellulose binding domain-containing protein [Planosporangium sp. 12N6]|uniref:cellulose binding domain-containing protein n=1 Tax=Planosporangium spinosum TaxID=3402278 RepID=UPI003CF1E0EA
MVIATLAIFTAQRLHANDAPGDRHGAAPTPHRSPATKTPERTGCTAAFTVTSTWPSGFQASVTIQTTGSTPINGWTVTWAFPSDQTVTQMWNGHYTQTKAVVTVRSEGWNGSPAAEDSIRFGFVGSGSAPDGVQNLTCTVAAAGSRPGPSSPAQAGSATPGMTAPAPGTTEPAPGTTAPAPGTT